MRILLLMLLHAAIVYAEDVRPDSLRYVLPEQTIMGLRWQTQSGAIPQSVTSITQRELEFANPQTAADAIGHTGQVFVQKSQLGGGSPLLRGFAANSVLLVMDNVRLNNAIYRGGNLQNIIQLDASTLEHAEVLFGPGSVMYGSDALGGVMIFNTPTPRPSFSNAAAVRGGGFTRYSSANFEQTGHAHIELGYRRWGFLTGLTYSDFDDLRAGSVRPDGYPDYGKRPEYVVRVGETDVIVANDDENLQKPSGYSQFNLLQKVSYFGSPRWQAHYAFYYSTSSNIPRYDRLLEYRKGRPRAAQWYYGPQDWLMNRIQLRLTDGGGLYDEASIIAAQQYAQESRHDRGFASESLAHRTEAIDVYSLNADLGKRIAAGQQLLYGLELTHNDVISEAVRENLMTGELGPESTRYPDGGSTLSSVAAYVGHDWATSRTTALETGLRYTHTLLNSKFADKRFYAFPFDEIDVRTGALTGSVGLSYHPVLNTRLFGSLSSGFRAPNVDDVGKVFDSEPGSVVVPNPELGPEYSYNGELGLEQRWGDRWTARGAVYYSQLVNAMVRRAFQFNGQDSIEYEGTLSEVQAIVNAGRAYVTGFDLALSWDASRKWHARTMLTYTAGRDTEADVPLRHIPPLFGETRLKYERSRWSGEFFARYNFDKQFGDLAPEEQSKTQLYTVDGTPGWYTLNLRGLVKAHSRLDVSLGCENMMDIHYRPMSSGISAPGRNIIVALRTRF
ncbi:TonB-dependent receptor [candidate division KSB1 bacterium]|nr:TonB-dependent receptor [candidate division KSB1 bacterium]